MSEEAIARPAMLLAQPRDLPVGPIGRRGVGYWGVATLIASEAALFSYLLFAYFYTGATAQPGWLLDPRPDLRLALPNTLLLLASSGVVWFGESGVLTSKPTRALIGFGGAFVMGSVFVVVQWFEWKAKTFQIGTSSYGSLYFVTTGFHVAHVIVGLVILAALFAWTALDYFSPRRRLTVSAGVLYWHFVDIVWLFVFATFYVSPYLGFGRRWPITPLCRPIRHYAVTACWRCKACLDSSEAPARGSSSFACA
jgi:heme/copper-type cytochrome/quinol oxidase subunit 3